MWSDRAWPCCFRPVVVATWVSFDPKYVNIDSNFKLTLERVCRNE